MNYKLEKKKNRPFFFLIGLGLGLLEYIQSENVVNLLILYLTS